MATLRPGLRLRSTVCETEVIVIRAPEGDLDVRCGGAPMVPLEEAGEPTGKPESPFDGGTLLGKRYALDDPALELLCTKAGAGSLSLGTDPIPTKEARPLPSSD
jgi:hypothetical protein